MAGVCQGDPKNVTVDANGYLHLRISDGTTGWTASELFTTDRLGLGNVPVAGRRSHRQLRQERRPRAVPVWTGRRDWRRRHQRDRHRILALGPGERTQRRLDRLPGLGNDDRRAELHVLARVGDALDVAPRLVERQHRGRSFDRASTDRRNDRAHQELDVRACQPHGQHSPAAASAGDESLVLRLTALRRQTRRDRHSRLHLRPGQRRRRGRGKRGRGRCGSRSSRSGRRAAGRHGECRPERAAPRAGAARGQAGAGGRGEARADRRGRWKGGLRGADRQAAMETAAPQESAVPAAARRARADRAARQGGGRGAPDRRHSGSTGTAGASGSSSGCACAVWEPGATWPATAFWLFIVLSLLPRRAARLASEERCARRADLREAERLLSPHESILRRAPGHARRRRVRSRRRRPHSQGPARRRAGPGGRRLRRARHVRHHRRTSSTSTFRSCSELTLASSPS